MAPFRNVSAFKDMVAEKYPEINLEIIPYSGELHCVRPGIP